MNPVENAVMSLVERNVELLEKISQMKLIPDGKVRGYTFPRVSTDSWLAGSTVIHHGHQRNSRCSSQWRHKELRIICHRLVQHYEVC
jgi:hypothetical protein